MTGPEQAVQEQMRERRRSGIIWLVLALILAMVLGFAYRTDHRADDSDKRLAVSDSQVQTLKGQVAANGELAQTAKDSAEEANRRLVAAGEQPVPVPTEAPISPSATPETQPDGFTAEELAAMREIVADQIARTPAKVTQAEITQIARVAAALIPKPKDGKTPTVAELQPAVSAALDAFCAQDRCVGKPGTDGKPGEPGEPAPEVTDEQLLASAQQALAIYCAAETKPCEGKPGAAGKDAPPPYSVVDSDCVGDGNESYWRIYLSNGTDQKTFDTKGPCRIGPDPN